MKRASERNMGRSQHNQSGSRKQQRHQHNQGRMGTSQERHGSNRDYSQRYPGQQHYASNPGQNPYEAGPRWQYGLGQSGSARGYDNHDQQYNQSYDQNRPYNQDQMQGSYYGGYSERQYPQSTAETPYGDYNQSQSYGGRPLHRERQGWNQDSRRYDSSDMPQPMYYGSEQSDRGYDSQSEEHENNFRGRGPKGYQRSDERLTEAVSEAFYENDNVDASEISVKVKDGEVTLDGSVESREMKRMAEDLAESITGVKEVINHLRVHKRQSGTDTEREQGKGSGWQTKANAVNTEEQFTQKKRVGER